MHKSLSKLGKVVKRIYIVHKNLNEWPTKNAAVDNKQIQIRRATEKIEISKFVYAHERVQNFWHRNRICM